MGDECRVVHELVSGTLGKSRWEDPGFAPVLPDQGNQAAIVERALLRGAPNVPENLSTSHGKN
jgi:hypothetical protein